MMLDIERSARAVELLRRALPAWLDGRCPARPQSADGITLTRPLHREDGRLDPGVPAALLERRVRALAPWPGTFVEAAEGRLAILRAAVADELPGDVPGVVVADDGGLALTTASGRLRLLQVRPAGGRSMSGIDLRNGRPGWVGARLVHA